MGVISGIGGVVNGVPSVRMWEVSSAADLHAMVASNTKGGPVTLDGNEDWSGRYNAWGPVPEAMPGEAFTFAGSIDGSRGAAGTAVVDSVEITIDVEGGAPVSHVVNFSANGVLTLGEAVGTDTSTPEPFTSIGCKVELSDALAGPAFNDLPDVRTVVITIEAANQEYATSSTGGTKRRVAGNISARVSITVYVDDFADLPAVNDVKAVRVYVDSTTFWLFDWLRFGEASGLEVDREGATPVGATLNGQWTAFADVEGAWTEGHISKPDTTDFWPAA